MIDKLLTDIQQSPYPKAVNRLTKQLKSTQWGELPPFHRSSPYIAYCEDKGKSIQMCLRNQSGNLEDFNTGVYILLHELAHIMCTTVTVNEEHNDEFNTYFRFLLQKAIENGLYHPVNYHTSPRQYCGEWISETPLFKKY